jgi:hypothetical protein
MHFEAFYFGSIRIDGALPAMKEVKCEAHSTF